MKDREQTLIGGFLIVAVIIIGYFFIVEPQSKVLSTNWSKMVTNQATVATNTAQLDGLTQQEQSLKNVVNKMPAKELPKPDLSIGQNELTVKRELLNEIVEIAEKSAGNSLVSIEPLAEVTPPPTPTPEPTPVPTPDPNNPNAVAPPAAPPPVTIDQFITTVAYKISIRGTYTSINQFLADLNGYEKILEISNIEITPMDEASRNLDPTKPLKATITMNMFINKGNLSFG